VAYNLVDPYSNQLVLDRDSETGEDIQNTTILTGGEYNLTVILDIGLTAAYANLTISSNLGHTDSFEYYERWELLLNCSILEKKIGKECLKLFLHSHFEETPLQEAGDSLWRIG
jgi:hypothetical protein